MDATEGAELDRIGPIKRAPEDCGPDWPDLSGKQRTFLKALSEAGTLRAATLASGISRANHARWIKQDAYAAAFKTAREMAYDTLEEEARRRAFGWDEPIFHGGKIVGYRRRYSDQLLMLLLKAARPEKYRDNIGVQHAALKQTGRVVIYEPEDWYGPPSSNGTKGPTPTVT